MRLRPISRRYVAVAEVQPQRAVGTQHAAHFAQHRPARPALPCGCPRRCAIRDRRSGSKSAIREAGTSKQGVYQAIRRGVLRRGPDGLLDPGSSRTSPGSNHCPSVGPAGLIGRGTPLNVANASRLPRFGTSNSRRWLPRAWSAGARMRTSAVKCTRSLYISDNPRFPYVECRENSSFYGAGKWTALGVYTAQPACSKSGSFPGFRVLRGAARAADRARGWDFKAGCVPSDPARRAAARPSYEPRPAHLIARAGPYRSVQILRGPAFARAMSGLTPVAVAREAGTSKQGVYQAIRRGARLGLQSRVCTKRSGAACCGAAPTA